MKKVLKVAAILFVSVVVVIVLILNFFGGRVIHKAVNVAGPAALGVPVTLGDAEFGLLRGRLMLRDLKVGNPEGFKTDSLFELGTLEVKLDPRSLLSDTIRIEKILIAEPKITYERGLTDSNLGALIDQLSKGEPEKPAEEPELKPEEPPAGEAPAKKVVIDEITISGASLKASVTIAQGFGAVLPLPPIVLEDIGKESDGASPLEVLQRILRAILGSVTDVLAASGKLAVEGVKLVGEGATAVGGAAVDGAAAVGGAAVDGAAAVGGVAVDGVKAVGSGAAAVGGAVVDGIGSLFGGGDEKKEAASE